MQTFRIINRIALVVSYNLVVHKAVTIYLMSVN